MQIYLKDFSKSTFRFYLKDDFRGKIFDKLKSQNNDWRIIAHKLGINPRHLFGIRRGWELRHGKRTPFLINMTILSQLSQLTHIPLHQFEQNIISIKHGQIGAIRKICFPLTIKLSNLNPYSILSSVFDYKYSQLCFRSFQSRYQLPSLSEKHIIRPQISESYIHSLRIRGLSPVHTENTLTYRIPGSSSFKKIYLPPLLIFNEPFAKQFGKWLGDRCGGSRKIGVSNKEYIFVREFATFIHDVLGQNDYKFYLTCNKKFDPPFHLITLADNKVKVSPTQYGDYAFRVEVSNALLKREVFDYLEKNALSILINSHKELRYAYYAGLLEADGSINDDNTITIAFGLSLHKPRMYKENLALLKKATELSFLLERDGFKPRISRKISNTEKTHTLKYDVNLLINQETRKQEVIFIKNTIGSFLTHPGKRQKLIELEEKLEEKNRNKTRN